MSAQISVQYIGSRELHRDLPKVLDSLGDSNARFVLTVHSKPKAVLIGAEAFQALLRRATPADHLLAMQLEALAQGLGTPAAGPERDGGPDQARPITPSEN